MVRLRRFLYLDGELTNAFLSQAGGDIYAEESQTEESERSAKRGGALALGGARAEGSRDTGQKLTSQRTVIQTLDAGFTQLADLLEAEDAVQYLEALDDGIWRQLRRGEAVELECNISVPALVQVGLLVATTPIAEIAKAFGTQMPPESETVIQQIATIIGMLKVLPLISEISGSPAYKIVAPINPLWLRVLLDELSGEATVFGTIEKKLKPGESWGFGDAMGLGGLSRQLRREFDKDVGSLEALDDFTVHAPAAVVKPVAIYR